MKKISLLFAVVCMAAFAFAQRQIIVQNGSKTETYELLDDAYAAAVAGDTLYLPGGGFNLTNSSGNKIDKKLHWVGAGHYPDATTATGITKISSPLYFSGNCDGSTFEGIHFSNPLYFGDNDNETTDVVIKRCKTGSSIYLRSITTGTPDLNFYATENLFLSSVEAKNGSACKLTHNVFSSSPYRVLHNFNKSLFSFNTFLVDTSGSIIYKCSFCSFRNNIFAYVSKIHTESSNCNFAYNVFERGFPYPSGGDSNGNNGGYNIYNAYKANSYQYLMFKDTSTGSYPYFQYANDYHLNPSVLGYKEETGAKVNITGNAEDGTNAGIYGSSTPYKADAIPYYPHITNAAVDANANETDKTLHIQFGVEAQDK